MVETWPFSSTKVERPKLPTQRIRPFLILVLLPTPSLELFFKSSKENFQRTPPNGTDLLTVWSVFLKKLPLVYTDFTSWLTRESSFSQLSMLTILLPSPSSITFMVANTLYQMVFAVLPMS